MSTSIKSFAASLPNDYACAIFEFAPATNIPKVCKHWNSSWSNLLPLFLKRNWAWLSENAALLAPLVQPAPSDHLARFKQLRADLKARMRQEVCTAIFKSFSGSLSFRDYIGFELCLGSNWGDFFQACGKKDEKAQRLIAEICHSREINALGLSWRSIPTMLFRFEHLVVLNLSQNQLSSPPSLKEMQCLRRLEYLGLKNNPIHKSIQLQFKQSVAAAAPTLRLCEMDDYTFTTRSAVNLQKIWSRLAVQLGVEDNSSYGMFCYFAPRDTNNDPLLGYTALDLSNLELTHLPREFWRFKNVKEINLKGNPALQKELEEQASSFLQHFPKLKTCKTDAAVYTTGPAPGQCVIS